MSSVWASAIAEACDDGREERCPKCDAAALAREDAEGRDAGGGQWCMMCGWRPTRVLTVEELAEELLPSGRQRRRRPSRNGLAL